MAETTNIPARYLYTLTIPSVYFYYDYTVVWITLGVVFGLNALSAIIVLFIYLIRQKKRKAWYGRMAEHYRNGGLPPWETGVGDGSVKSPLVSPTQSAYPTPQYENPSQVGVYGNLPTTPYENLTGVTGYTAANPSTKSVPPTPVTQSLSPQPHHSQYLGTSYNAPTNVGHSILSPPFTGTPAQFSPTSSPPQGAPSPNGIPTPHSMSASNGHAPADA